MFGFIKSVGHRKGFPAIRSGEGLTLEKSALNSLYGDQVTINSLC